MIKISYLQKTLDGKKVLDDLSLEIKKAEIFVILGESGSGKSVLLRHLMGLMRPDQGSIEIDEVDITKLSENKLLKYRRAIGFLFQEGALYDFMTVYENIAFPLREHTNLKNPQIREKVENILKMVDLEGVEERYPSELSGGMKKRVALARAVILDSKMLFCDEPTSGLDPIRSRDISDLIEKISRQLQCTTVIVSHDIKNALRIADRIALLHQGKMAYVGTQQQLKFCKDPLVKEFLN